MKTAVPMLVSVGITSRKKPDNLSNGNPAVVLVLLSPSFFLADEALMEELSEIRDAVLPCRNLLLLTEQCCIQG